MKQCAPATPQTTLVELMQMHNSESRKLQWQMEFYKPKEAI